MQQNVYILGVTFLMMCLFDFRISMQRFQPSHIWKSQQFDERQKAPAYFFVSAFAVIRIWIFTGFSVITRPVRLIPVTIANNGRIVSQRSTFVAARLLTVFTFEHYPVVVIKTTFQRNRWQFRAPCYNRCCIFFVSSFFVSFFAGIWKWKFAGVGVETAPIRLILVANARHRRKCSQRSPFLDATRLLTIVTR